jgi:hypothetical protein
MKTLLKLMGLAIFVVAIGFGCKKTAINSSNEADEVFDVSAVKAWYYGTFARSAEFKANFATDKKYVNWKYPSFSTNGDAEIIEFPLMKEKTDIRVSSKTTLSKQNSQMLAVASLKRVVFIKTKNGQIHVRELNYVPELEYLTLNKFDISSQNIGQPTFNFTGRLYVKKWDGATIGIHNYKDGKAKSKIKKIDKTVNNLVSCHTEEQCEWQEVCIIVHVNDLPDVPVCDWHPVNCTNVEICEEIEDPDPDLCELHGICTPEEECNMNPTQECMCAIYGMGCIEPGGGGDNPPETCTECGNVTEAQAQAQLNEITNTPNYAVGTSILGVETAPDANGIIKKPWANHGITYSYTRLGYWTSTYAAHYTGKLYKNNQANEWKFESINFNDVHKISGQLPPCFSTQIASNIQAGVVENGNRAQGVGSFSITFIIQCAEWGATDKTYTETLNGLEKFDAQ